MVFPRARREGRRALFETNQPLPNQQKMIVQPSPPKPEVQTNDVAELQDADDTFPVEGKTHLEKEGEKTILEHIIDNL
jgi:hypothetical protein